MNQSNSTVVAENLDWTFSLIMLAIVCFLGTIGNLLVIGVYVQHYFYPQQHRRSQHAYNFRYSQQAASNGKFTQRPSLVASDEQLFTRNMGTATFFMLVLATVDLMACLLAVPISFYMEFIHMKPSHDIWCKVHAFITVCNIMFSSLLVIAIALDRYLAICHPLHRILTMPRAKVLTLCLGIFCIIYGLLGTQTIQLASTHPNEQPECKDINQLENITDAQKVYYQIVQKGNTASFILSIIVVIILYSIILKVVIRTHRRMQRSSRYSQAPIPEQDTKAMEDSNPTLESADLAKHGNGQPASADNFQQDCSQNTNNDNHRKSHLRSLFSIRSLTETSLWKEIRSASVLFVVAVVFIIVFTPSLLTANNLVSFSLIGYNFCMLNSATNPFIYCFMSGAFRRHLRTLLFSLSARRRDAMVEDFMFNQPRRRERRKTTMSMLNDNEIS